MSRIQVKITLPEALRAVIDPVRLKWSSPHAVGNPAHLTIIYQDEAPDVDLMLRRLRAALNEHCVFSLDLGGAMRFADPDRGAFLSVADATGGVASIRSRVLAPPFAARERFGLHVTVLHPRFGERLEAAWPELCAIPAAGSFLVDEVQVVGPDNEVIERLPLASGRG